MFERGGTAILKAMSETPTRSLIKSLSWRFVNVVSDFALIFILTRKVDFALKFAALAFVLAITLYYFHERIWNMFSWGRKQAE